MKQFMWVIENVSFLLVVTVGFFLGLAGFLLAQLVGMGGWLMALILVVGGAVTLAVPGGIDRVFVRIFPTGIKKAAPKLEADAEQVKKLNFDNEKHSRSGLVGFGTRVVIAHAISFFPPPQRIMAYF